MRPPGVGSTKQCVQSRLKSPTLLALAALLVCLLILPSGAGAAVEPEAAAPCSRGEALEALGKFEAAEAAYLEDLKTRAGLECAPARLTALKSRVEAEQK